MRRTLVKLRIGCHLLKLVGTTKSLSMNGCVVITFRTKRISNKIVRDIPRRETFLSKIETKVDDIRKLSHENLISQLINSNDYYVNLRLMMFISSCFERQIDLTLIGILDKCYDLYQSLNCTLITKLL